MRLEPVLPAREIQDAIHPGGPDAGRVAPTIGGSPLEPRIVNRAFYGMRADAGLPWLRLHELRHAFATVRIDQADELCTVIELLGHSTIRLTADTCGRVLPTRARAAADALDRAIGDLQ